MISDRYERERVALLDLVTSEPDKHAQPVPACPGWTVLDIVRHGVGLCDDWLTGRLEIYASPEWTRDQVERFESSTLSVLRSAWDERAPAFHAILDDPGAHDHLPAMIATVIGEVPTVTFPSGILVDLVQHSFDIASALERRPVVGVDHVALCNRGLTTSLAFRWKIEGLPTVRIQTTDTGEEYRLGEGDVATTLRASSVDLLRTFGGRRTAAQTEALAWSGDMGMMRAVVTALTVPFFRTPQDRVEPATDV